jgi:hypothetical protein
VTRQFGISIDMLIYLNKVFIYRCNHHEYNEHQDCSKMSRCEAPANEQPECTLAVREDCEFAGNEADGHFSTGPPRLFLDYKPLRRYAQTSF